MRVRLERDGDIAIVWISAEKIPLLTKSSLEELYNALREADESEDLNGIMLAPEGKDFCGGADVKELSELDFENCLRWFRRYISVVEFLRETGKPTLAAVRGACVAGGNEIAMACDFVIAGKSARFGQPEVRVGSTAMGLGVQLLPLVIGERRARELLLTGRILSADEAFQLGLINRVVDDEELIDFSKNFLKEVIENVSPQAFKVIKAGLKFWTDLAMLNYPLARDLTSFVWLSEEFRERVKAFLSKERAKKRSFLGTY